MKATFCIFQLSLALPLSGTEKPLVIAASGLSDGITITSNESSRLFEITEAVGDLGAIFDSLSITRGKAEDIFGWIITSQLLRKTYRDRVTFSTFPE